MALGTAAALGLSALASAAPGIIGGIVAGGQKKPGEYFKPLESTGISGADSQSALMRALQSAQQSQGALNQQQQFAQQAGQMGGLQNLSDVYAQQQALAGQLGQLAAGQGPNPALEQLRQATGQNVANQAALMAGQRGAGGNVGLMARQIGQQGATTQQQAVGQAAALQAQQQLGAIGALQQQQQMLGGLAGGQASMQAEALRGLMQGTQGLQGLNQQQQQALMQAILSQRGQELQQQTGQAGAQNVQNVQEREMWGNIAKGIGGGLSAMAGGMGGIGGGAASAGSSPVSFGMSPQGQKAWMDYANPYKAHGGEIKGYAEGGPVAADSSNQSAVLKEHYDKDANAPKSFVGRHFYASGGSVQDMRSGGHVPGKAPVGGAVDSYKNDVVDAKLSPGEIVLPRSVTQSENPAEAAARFVAAIKAKKGK